MRRRASFSSLRDVVIGLVVLACLADPVKAKLGESQDETILRYGKRAGRSLSTEPLLPGALEHEYHYKGWLIRVAFVDGKVVRQSFQKMGSNSGAIVDIELEAILEPEGGKSTWQAVPEPEAGSTAGSEAAAKRWLRAADNATATLLNAGLTFVVESPAAAEFERKMKAERDEGAKKALPKF